MEIIGLIITGIVYGIAIPVIIIFIIYANIVITSYIFYSVIKRIIEQDIKAKKIPDIEFILKDQTLKLNEIEKELKEIKEKKEN